MTAEEREGVLSLFYLCADEDDLDWFEALAEHEQERFLELLNEEKDNTTNQSDNE